MHQFVRLLQQGLRYGKLGMIGRENPAEIGVRLAARVREATRVTGLTASGLQALTLLQRPKKKKEGCKRRTALPAGFLPADFFIQKRRSTRQA